MFYLKMGASDVTFAMTLHNEIVQHTHTHHTHALTRMDYIYGYWNTIATWLAIKWQSVTLKAAHISLSTK